MDDLGVSKDVPDAAGEEINTTYLEHQACAFVADISIEEQVNSMIDGAVNALGWIDAISKRLRDRFRVKVDDPP